MDPDLTTSFSHSPSPTLPPTDTPSSQSHSIFSSSTSTSTPASSPSLSALSPTLTPTPFLPIPLQPSASASTLRNPLVSPKPVSPSTPTPPPAPPSSKRHLPLFPSSPVPPSPPTSLYWSLTPHSGRIPKGLRAHSSTLIGDDIYCFGGCDIRGQCYKDVWKLDTNCWVWGRLKTVGTGPGVSRAHTAVGVDGRLWVFGGGDGPNYFNDTWCFDTLTQTWSKPLIHGTPPSRRRAHTTIHYHNLLLIFGGGNGSHALNDLHALDLSDLSHLVWRELETKGEKPIARGYHSMTRVGDKAVVFGGSDGTECFSDLFLLDLETLHWTEIKSDILLTSPSSPHPTTTSFNRLSHSATCVGSYIFIIGGHDGINFSNEVLLFNLVTLQWEPRTPRGLPPTPRGYHTTIFHDSRILLIGGFDGQVVFDQVWTMDLAGSSFLNQITNFCIGGEESEEEGSLEVEVGR